MIYNAIAVLFGCDPSFLLKGLTYTNTDTDDSVKNISNQNQFFDFFIQVDVLAFLQHLSILLSDARAD